MNFFTKRSDSYREKWGYAFEWTEEHLSDDEINRLRRSVDNLGDQALEKLHAIVAKQKSALPEGTPFTKPDLYTVLAAHYEEDDVLSTFWNELHKVPDWVDWVQVDRAQKFFGRYALANSTSFALQGFIRENSVSNIKSVSLTNHRSLSNRDAGFPRNCRSVRAHRWLCHQKPAFSCH